MKPDKTRQQGAALFMALIFLLIMTILGVYGMNQSRLENMMAGNHQFQTLALNHAELMLDAGILSIQENIGPPYSTPEFSQQSSAPRSPATHEQSVISVTTPPPGAHSGYSYHYRVEHLGTLDSSVDGYCSAAIGTGNLADDCTREVYRVTGKSNTSRGARRTIQSVFIAADMM